MLSHIYRKFFYNFIEFKLKPIFLKHFLFLVFFYNRYLFPLKADFSTIFNYYILKRRLKPKLKIPDTLIVVPSDLCNANCVFCAYRHLSYEKQFLSFELFKKAIDDYKKLGGKSLMLSPTIGEDLINKDFFEFIKYAKKQDFHVAIFTNGILLNTNENYKKIIEFGIDDIFISTGDILPKFEAEVFGIPIKLALEKLKGVIHLLEYKKETKSNIKITIGFRAKRPFREIWNTMKYTKFKYFFDKKYFHILFKTCYDNWCGNITEKDLLGIMKLRRSPKLKKYPCSALWSISVLPNGDIRLCGCRIKKNEYDDLVIGNLKNNDLFEILNNKKGEDVLVNWMNGKLVDVCVDCIRYGFPKIIKNKNFQL
ncbi:MAG: radical SAM/SPASM domain-containing protein [Promethearchaeota archaeon]